METADLTLEILKDIRSEVRGTNLRIDGLDARIDQTNERIDETNVRIDQVTTHLVRVETRIATELIAVAAAIGDVRDDLRASRSLGARVDGLEARVTVLEKKKA